MAVIGLTPPSLPRTTFNFPSQRSLAAWSSQVATWCQQQNKVMSDSWRDFDLLWTQLYFIHKANCQLTH